MRRLLAIVGALALAGVLAMPLFAHTLGWGRGHHMMWYWGGDPGCCWRPGGGYDSLTEEQRSQLDTLHQEFHDVTARVENEIEAKQAELNTLLTPVGTLDVERALELREEISELRAKLGQERTAFEIEVRKLAPKGSYGRAYGMNCCWHMGGYGPGMWWN
jgi:Spy/CpxP family protein refolding chaperone